MATKTMWNHCVVCGGRVDDPTGDMCDIHSPKPVAGEHICGYAAFDVAKGDVCKGCRSNPPTTLNLYEVTVHPDGRPGPMTKLVRHYIMVLDTSQTQAERTALKALNMSDPGGRIKMDTVQMKGPFRRGRVISVRTS